MAVSFIVGGNGRKSLTCRKWWSALIAWVVVNPTIIRSRRPLLNICSLCCNFLLILITLWIKSKSNYRRRRDPVVTGSIPTNVDVSSIKLYVMKMVSRLATSPFLISNTFKNKLLLWKLKSWPTTYINYPHVEKSIQYRNAASEYKWSVKIWTFIAAF